MQVRGGEGVTVAADGLRQARVGAVPLRPVGHPGLASRGLGCWGGAERLGGLGLGAAAKRGGRKRDAGADPSPGTESRRDSDRLARLVRRTLVGPRLRCY